ncbi:MAG: 3-deoxy-D-manno-octulosonic acid transferase [Flavobacteriales bacterium]|nr:3-deoxy-D-manno-octulosonic acid transferase [Flavobacteriales bacterium]
MPLLTDLGAAGYHAGVRLAAPFVPKARAWVDGRKGLWARLEARRDALQGGLWMHCASVGEFEQGRPVLEAIKRERPELPVLLTFFSPSGFEARKDFPLATHVDYLPADTAANARRFMDLVRPSTVLWVKYEFWYHHLHAVKKAGVPAYLVSAILRPGQPFFRWYGGAWRNMLAAFTHLFVQDEPSRALLSGIGVTNVTVTGDTRFDRVMDIVGEASAHAGDLEIAAAFRSHNPTLLLGSTWPKDEELILAAYAKLNRKPKVIIAPHELHEDQLLRIEARFPKPLVRWSELTGTTATNIRATLGQETTGTLLVDRMGLLARLYAHGDVAYVGGGFSDGIHSLLEAAAWGRPVIFGPNHRKFAEAQGLIEAGAGFEVRNMEDLVALLDRLFADRTELKRASEAAARFVKERTGATNIIAKTCLGSMKP